MRSGVTGQCLEIERLRIQFGRTRIVEKLGDAIVDARNFRLSVGVVRLSNFSLLLRIIRWEGHPQMIER